MDSTWKLKAWAMVTMIVLAVYALVPTFLHFPETREALSAANKPVPWYFDLFPEKAINLGLDLRGGIYIEMDVQLNEAMRTKLDLLGNDLVRDLKDKNIEPVSWGQDDAHENLQFVFKNDADLQTSLGLIDKNYKSVLGRSSIPDGGPSTLQLSLNPQYASQIRKDILAQAVQAVRNRIDRYGLAEPTVQRQGETRLVVELPGMSDPERAIKIIQQAGKLEFKIVNAKINPVELGNLIAAARKDNTLPTAYSAEDVEKLNSALKSKLPTGTEIAFEIVRDSVTGQIAQAKPYLLDKTSYITGDMLSNAQVQTDSRSSEPYVSITFNPTGAKNFAELTKTHVKELLAIMLDGNVSSAPQIREPILNGQCRIDLGGSRNRQEILQEAKDLVLVLQEGALPARLKEASKTVIGPTLGADSIQKSLNSMLIATFIVVLFMIFYYRLSGVLADAAVIINTLFVFALLAMFQATLTLPGMAGIVLTFGMSVDTNVLILERIREELKAGQQPRNAVDSGYKHAMRAIIDSHVTTIIAGIILYQFGTGPVRGFAVTLMIGLVCNLFTAISMTRVVYDYFLIKRKVQKISI
ncbi:MAG: protein translocase subunit SecD [Deltaproteobacteria bacterium]|nr:protein translocase subunit SecD [Deltaproteobacteria bacterium]